ncbi:glycosyltransferase family 4 protein [Cellulosimicrobium cellulans]|uniref:glycosyltransferase family 4 protein n=1 Tax=Cellulosimicrobium cellulans TaxID=1710 RepID=UPI003660FDFC
MSGGTVRSRRLVHVITPGDHFSPRTGSAVPTVVDGLSRAAAPGSPVPRVVVAAGTYPERYPSASALEYPQVHARRTDRYVDAALSRAGLPRRGARRVLTATTRTQGAWDPSWVLAHNAPALVPLVDARRHVPLLYCHNQVLRTYTPREAARALGPAAAVVCVSDHLAEQVRARLPRALRDRVVTVRNGVDVEAFAVPRSPRGDRLRVVYVGRVIADKGVHVLLDAVARGGRHDVEVTVVGRPGFAADAPLSPYERELRSIAARSRASVRFASFVDRTRLPALLAAADVLVVPSVWPEPFGLTALEGMAAGAAVVASDVGGLPEAVGTAATLVPPGDVAALADALAALADDGALSRAQDAARAHARRNDWDVARARLDAVLEDARRGVRA